MGEQDWKKTAQAKRDEVINLIPKEWRIAEIPSVEQQRDVTGPYIQQFLSQKEIEITETDAVGITQKTTTGEWSALDVAKAFCHRAALAHQLTNCLHEIFFDAALEDAKALDDYFQAHHQPVGPLHGLPVSLKDQFHVRGVETHMGYIGWINTFQGHANDPRHRTFESEMVRELRALGAILYVKTSVPHTLMSGETVNNIIEYTWNPNNRNLATGGSSGGEGALIACRGSPIGFGTDIGGSIRIPAAFNGLYGIRPSHGRLPYEGMANTMDGQNSVLSVVGPISHSVASLRMMIKALLSQQPWLYDPLVNEIPWRDEQEKQILDLVGSLEKQGGSAGKMAFGLLSHDGEVTPMPPVRRALEIVAGTLKKLGHEVIEWKPPSHKTLNDICLKTWLYDGGADLKRAFALSGEPMAPQISVLYASTSLEEVSATAIAANNVAKRDAQKAYLDYWNSTSELTSTGRSVDAVIAPVAPFPAARPEKYVYYGYSMFVNLLDFTSVVVPVTRVDKAVDNRDEGYKALNDVDGVVFESYDPEIYDGAPVAVQLVGRRLQEEKMLALAEYVGNAITKQGDDSSVKQSA